MRGCLSLTIALLAIKSDLFAAEAGMPQLDPKYWASQAFWLILIFIILYISIALTGLEILVAFLQAYVFAILT